MGTYKNIAPCAKKKVQSVGRPLSNALGAIILFAVPPLVDSVSKNTLLKSFWASTAAKLGTISTTSPHYRTFMLWVFESLQLKNQWAYTQIQVFGRIQNRIYYVIRFLIRRKVN